MKTVLPFSLLCILICLAIGHATAQLPTQGEVIKAQPSGISHAAMSEQPCSRCCTIRNATDNTSVPIWIVRPDLVDSKYDIIYNRLVYPFPTSIELNCCDRGRRSNCECYARIYCPKGTYRQYRLNSKTRYRLVRHGDCWLLEEDR